MLPERLHHRAEDEEGLHNEKDGEEAVEDGAEATAEEDGQGEDVDEDSQCADGGLMWKEKEDGVNTECCTYVYLIRTVVRVGTCSFFPACMTVPVPSRTSKGKIRLYGSSGSPKAEVEIVRKSLFLTVSS